MSTDNHNSTTADVSSTLEGHDWPDDWDNPPDESELAEAAALIEALDGQASPRPESAAEAAFEVAGLVQYANRSTSGLDDDRSKAILVDVLAAVRMPKPTTSVWMRWLTPAAALSAAALGVVLLTSTLNNRSDLGVDVVASATLPSPTASLLQAQSAALVGGDPASLRLEMATYRGEMMASMNARYRGDQ